MNKRLKYLIVSASTALLALLLLGTQLHPVSAADDAYNHFKVFTDVISRVKSDYVEEPNMQNVTLGALNGMLESIDPYASYLSSDQYKQYLKSKESTHADVGLVIARRLGYVGIVDAVPGSPADQLGLTTGDVVEAINGVGTRDMPLAYAEILLQGDPGSKVDLSVMRVRKGTEAQQVGLVRENLKYPGVSASMINNEIGYLKVPSLNNSAKVDEVSARVKDLEKQGAKKLILDVRHDSVGSPMDGIALANLFLDKGLIATEQGQKFPKKEFQADPAKQVSKLPMVVIANRGTAGGAEVASAALLGNKRAEVVGERTYGNAADRKAVTMDDGGAVILSVAKYYGPDGKAIQDNYVMPSIPVVMSDVTADSDDDAAPANPTPAPKQDEDLMLRKAVEVLTIGLEASKQADAKRAQQAATQKSTPVDFEPLQMRPLNIPGSGTPK